MLVAFDPVAGTATIDPEDGSLPVEYPAGYFAALFYAGEASAAAIVRADGVELSVRLPPGVPLPVLERIDTHRWLFRLVPTCG